MFNSQLKTLVCVADCGSFAKASEKLFISVTAVMKQINSLEDHFNLKLLERNNQGIRLTSAGQSLYEDALKIFEFSQDAVARAHQIAGLGKTSFRIGSSILNPHQIFLAIWHKIESRMPNYDLKIVPFDDARSDILAKIGELGEKFDFLAGVCDSKAWLKCCRFHKLGEYKMCCAVPKGNRLFDKKFLKISDLSGEFLVMGKPGDSKSVDMVRDYVSTYPEITIKDTSRFY